MIKNNVNKEVIEYIYNALSNLYIEILSKQQKPVLELMENNKLEGWCWQTTESIILFLDDNDYIERGNLYFNKSKPYYHSWICFKYNNDEYVLDACFNILCKKQEYIDNFNTEVLGKVTAKEVKKEFIKQMTTPKEEIEQDYIVKQFSSFLKEICGDVDEERKKRKKEEIVVHAKEDVNTPLYRNGSGYITELEEGKVKKILVHYYLH